MTSIAVAALGFAAHTTALYSNQRLQCPPMSPEVTRYLGMFTWLTVQTNIICCCRFAAVLAASFLESTTLATLMVQLFPLSFALGFTLSLLYYGLNHFNLENIQATVLP